MHTLIRLLSVSLLAGICSLAQTTASNAATPDRKDTMTTHHAKGSFEVKISPQASPDLPPGVLGRMSIDKTFDGDLEATSKGEMLTAGSGGKGSSGGYVALEEVTGTLNGRSGTFVLQHNATMNRGVPQLNIIVVPGSGTGQLAGLTGTMNIIITDGKHAYDFEYTLPEPH